MVMKSLVGVEGRRVGLGGIVLLLILPLLQVTHAQTRASCPHACTPLRQCGELLGLLKSGTRENISKLQQLTCSYRNREPLVCCPQKTSLLPKSCGQTTGIFRILGGEVAPIGSHPWMAVLGYKDVGFPHIQFLCGGSVINNRYILTAAHCVHQSALGTRTLEVVRLGEWDLTTDPDCSVTRLGGRDCAPSAQNFTIEETIPHSNYNTRVQFSDDIALIRLSRPINFDVWVRPVCLPPQTLDVRGVFGEREGVAAGWGFTENGTTSDRLMHVQLPFVERERCNTTYGGNIIDDQICVGGVQGKDSCGGDSGGPLVLSGPMGPPYLQVGVVSYGPVNCGQLGVPGVYTSVSRYRSWIEENLKP